MENYQDIINFLLEHFEFIFLFALKSLRDINNKLGQIHDDNIKNKDDIKYLENQLKELKENFKIFQMDLLKH